MIDTAKAIRIAMEQYGVRHNCEFARSSGKRMMPQRMLAERLGVTRAYTSYIIINGVNKLDSIEKLAAALEVTTLELLALALEQPKQRRKRGTGNAK